jgi:hypothetical protein
VADLSYLGWAAADFHGRRGRWPTLDELTAHDPSLRRRDRWDQEFRVEATASGFVVRSAGVDRTWGTADDLASDPERGRHPDGTGPAVAPAATCRSGGFAGH